MKLSRPLPLVAVLLLLSLFLQVRFAAVGLGRRRQATGPGALSTTDIAPPSTPELEVLLQHFILHPGEQIHYTLCSEGNKPRCPDGKFTVTDPKIVRMIDSKGIVEAVTPGGTELVAQIPASQRRITVEVAGEAQSPILAVPYSSVEEITAKDTVLFVGHANLDGFDHTAVAKPGIDRLVQEAKKNRWPVVYRDSPT